VGWPVEYATGLVGLALNTADLFRLGEVDDEEASSVSTALDVLRSIFGERDFTSKQVAAVVDGFSPSSMALADALAELGGKKLDGVTPRRIGKLFQKTLVGRPAFISDGAGHATLVNAAGHNQNTYRIKLVGTAEMPEAA
jgi:hypothetical protein